MAFLPVFDLGAQVFVNIRTVFVDEGAEVVVGPSFFDDILPKGLEVLEGPFERGQKRDGVHEGAEIEPVNPLGTQEHNSRDRSFVLSDLVFLVGSRSRPGRDSGAVFTSLHGSAQAVEGVLEIVEV